MKKQQHLASDNYSGMCSEAFKYMIKANSLHELAYGDDEWTAKASDKFREIFDADCEVFFVFNGTAANSLSLATLCQSYHSIICHELAHIETDECGAPEFFSNGAKLLTAKGKDGKLNAEAIEEIVNKRDDIHYSKPKVVSITQATELGSVYSLSELKAIQQVCEKYKLRIHLDGARFANAVVALGLTPKELTVDCGVDVMSFGGIKNGLAFGEAVVFFNKKLAEEFDYRCKQSGQLASKMRFMSAPWLGLFENDVWLKNAAHANNCAANLAKKLSDIPQVEFLMPQKVNSVFLKLPPAAISFLEQKGWHFYTFIGVGGARFMCSWDTQIETIDRLVADVKSFFDVGK